MDTCSLKRITALTVSAIMGIATPSFADSLESRLVKVDSGYSKTSVNTAVFRTNSLVSHHGVQYISYYAPDGRLMLGKRDSDSDRWTINRTQYTGNVRDAHNVICMGIDGDGYLHVAFDHHGHKIKYAKGLKPGSLELGELTCMTGIDENNVTYPEFYSLKGGDLLFVYRSGASGKGNMVINRYDVDEKKWIRVQDSLIDGESERSPYWQVYVDSNDVIHVSWVWRETWLVETNHDMCYAKSEDGGKTWLKSDGTVCTLPITASNAEYAWHIPQCSELINQTSMTADSDSNPYIVTYWRAYGATVPQYRMIWHKDGMWKQRTISERSLPFSLSGGGTKMIPISRPRIVADKDFIGVVYRDAERGSLVTLSSTTAGPEGTWDTRDITEMPVGAWEPSIDTDLWRDDKKLNIFIQSTSQGDGEKAVDSPPTPIYVLEIAPKTPRVLK